MPTRSTFRDNKKAQFSRKLSHNLLFCTKNLGLSKLNERQSDSFEKALGK